MAVSLKFQLRNRPKYVLKIRFFCGAGLNAMTNALRITCQISDQNRKTGVRKTDFVSLIVVA